MYTRSSGQSAFDSVLCAGVTLVCPPNGEQPEVQATMVYVQKATGLTYGTCPLSSQLLSQRSLELIKSLVESLEEDAGAVVFGGEGTVTSPDDGRADMNLKAESRDGLQNLPRGLGWRG